VTRAPILILTKPKSQHHHLPYPIRPSHSNWWPLYSSSGSLSISHQHSKVKASPDQAVTLQQKKCGINVDSRQRKFISVIVKE